MSGFAGRLRWLENTEEDETLVVTVFEEAARYAQRKSTVFV